MNTGELSHTLGNISEACRKLGVSRQHYYDIKSAIKEDGIDGLIQKWTDHCLAFYWDKISSM